MPGGAVDFEALENPSSLLRFERLVERGRRVDVQIVHHLVELLAGKKSSTNSRIRSAQSRRVRRSVTLTHRHPSSGAKTMKRLAVPLRAYC